MMSLFQRGGTGIMSVIAITCSAVLIPLIAISFEYIASVRTDPHYHQPFNSTDIARLSKDKVILITGANAGLGRATSKLLAEGGNAKAVIMACRSIHKCEDAKADILQAGAGEHNLDNRPWKTKLIPMQVDLTSFESIKKFAHDVELLLLRQEEHDEDAFAKLDIIINNAGIMAVPYQLATGSNVEMQMHVNHLAHFAMISLLYKNLRRGARIVNVSSLAGSFPFLNLKDVNFQYKHRATFRHYFGTLQSIMSYGASKRANLLFTHSLNKFSKCSNVTAMAAHPGYSRTSIMYNGWAFAPSFLKYFFGNNKIGSMSSEEGALSQLRAALDVDHVAADAYVGPLFFTAGRPVVIGGSMKSYHHFFWPLTGGGDKIADELWKFSEDSIGWKFDESCPAN
jgi:NAD(P)-dependent dehydrogenase (short-subunit alcohol dehydrogenase family)